MTKTRTARRQNVRGSRLRLALVGVGVLAILAGILVALLATRGSEPAVRIPESAAQRSVEVSASLDSTVTMASQPTTATIECPKVVGLTVKEARLVLSAASLTLEVRSEAGVVQGDMDDLVVESQEPAAGIFMPVDSIVTGLVPTSEAAATAAAPGVVVCIDPGHQSRSNMNPEPVGPGSSETKASVSGGTTGVSTAIPEYEITLQISMNLKQRLEAEGITVVMTRTTNDVDVPNSERAQIANESGAALFVRIHADGSTDSSVSGISTLYPGTNTWTGPITADSSRIAGIVQDAVVASTGAVSRGTVARTDISGFNWSEVPSVLVECGFMSNPVEDKLLASPYYQDKIAQGIADGILTYLGR